ncbi:unnamed protein product [Caenorhabditis nigoni]|nr:hypothetical protein B9Z55_027750 [Caenorhabditis nigoni]
MIGGMVHSCIQLLLEIFKDLDSLVYRTILLLSNLIYAGFFVRHTWCIYDYCFFDFGPCYYLFATLSHLGLFTYFQNYNKDFPWYNIHLFILCLMDWTMIKFGWLRVDITMNGEKKIELETLPTVCDNVEQSKEMWNDMKAAPFSPLSNINSCANIH